MTENAEKEAAQTPAFHQVPPIVQKLVPVFTFNDMFPSVVFPHPPPHAL